MKTLRNSIRNCLVLLVILASLAMGQQDEIAKLKDLVDKAKTDKLALRQLQSLADQGNAVAQSNLGSMYARGEGVPKDPVEAVKWVRKAADQGNANAQHNLGVMYDYGDGVPKNTVEAVKWYRKAADQGYASAQHNLGVMYATGEGVSKDPVEAVKWYRKAADQGDADAQTNLGSMYARGEGVSQDWAEAVKWFRKAADQGNASAQHNLGVMYARGQGVSKDPAEAVKWYRKAADQGFAAAQKTLESPELKALAKQEAKAAELQAYSQRPKTTLEQVLNYTTTANVNSLSVNGSSSYWWISGANGQNKCVLESRTLILEADRAMLGSLANLAQDMTIDIRRLSGVGFRISKDWVGDEQSKIPRAAAAVLERLQKAWGLAFAECPSVEKAPF